MTIPLPGILKARRFLPLFITQFLGAFNDNVFKNALVMLITYKLAAALGGNAQVLVAMAGGIFILPYMLFSATAGQLADKYDRAWLARRIKLAEIVIVSISAVGFYTNEVYFLMFVLFCLGIQATFFGTIKYALLPQHLEENELIEGNAWIEAGTFLSILIGTIAGGLLILHESGAHLISITMVLAALGGYAASRYIPRAPAPDPSLVLNWNVAQETWRIVRNDMGNRRLFLSIIGISWFWLVGSVFLLQFPLYAKDVLSSDETVVTLFLTIFSVGIGIGSLLCTRLLKGEVKSTYVPWGALGITLFTIDLFFASHAVFYTPQGVLLSARDFLGLFAGWRILFDLLGVAISAGIYIVPLYAIMQHDSDPKCRARTIASNNIINAIFIVAAALGCMVMLKLAFTVPQVFLTMAVLNGAVAGYIVRLKK